MNNSSMNLIRHLIVISLLSLISACSTFKPEALSYGVYETGYKNKKMRYGVYTPPNWTVEEKLPVVLFLHGGGDNHTSFEKFQAHEEFDRRINAGDMPRVILVTPDGDLSLWENWADGKKSYRDWVMRGVLPAVQKEYNTLSCPKHCHLLGISMGGYGAMRFAYFEKNTFSSISVLSAAIFTDEQKKGFKNRILIRLFFPIKKIFGPDAEERNKRENVFHVWPTEPHLRNIRFQMIWGNKDTPNIKSANEKFHQALNDAGVEHDSYVYDGNHKWVSWKPQLSRAVNFLVNSKENKTVTQK